MELGFSNVSRLPRIVYVAKEGGSLWHFWSVEKQEIEPILANSISGYLRRLEVVATTSEKYGVSDKLRIHLEAGKENFVLQSGIDSWFSKSLLRNLGCLTRQQLLNWIAIEPYTPDQGSKVIFARVYDSQNQRIYSGEKYPYEKDKKGNVVDSLDYRKIILEIQSRLPVVAADEFSELIELAERDNTTGEVLVISPSDIVF